MSDSLISHDYLSDLNPTPWQKFHTFIRHFVHFLPKPNMTARKSVNGSDFHALLLPNLVRQPPLLPVNILQSSIRPWQKLQTVFRYFCQRTYFPTEIREDSKTYVEQTSELHRLFLPNSGKRLKFPMNIRQSLIRPL